MKNPSKPFLIAITSTLLLAAIPTPMAFAKDTITQKEFLKIKAEKEAAEQAVRDATPKDSKARSLKVKNTRG